SLYRIPVSLSLRYGSRVAATPKHSKMRVRASTGSAWRRSSMVSRRGLGAVAPLIASAVLLTGCVPQGVPAATDRARTQFAEMKAQFATNAPPVRADDFVDYVRTARLDARA